MREQYHRRRRRVVRRCAQACRLRRSRVMRCAPVKVRLLLCCREALQFAADVLIITGIDVGREHFFNNGQEISERLNCRQWSAALRPRKPAERGEGECVFDGDEWQSALIKLYSQQAVATAYDAAGARSRTISFEQPVDIVVLIH